MAFRWRADDGLILVVFGSTHQLKKKKAGLRIKVHNYFSTKTYVMGSQKNCLNEMIILST